MTETDLAARLRELQLDLDRAERGIVSAREQLARDKDSAVCRLRLERYLKDRARLRRLIAELETANG